MNQLFAHLKRFFNDSNKKNTAQRIIKEFRIKNRFFTKYLIDFQRYIKDINYNINARKFLLETDLFNELKDYLININVRELFYEDLINKCYMIND